LRYHFFPMTEPVAQIISNWTYPKPYDLYSMDGSEACFSELMNGDYFYAEDNAGRLAGFVCLGNSARVPGGYEAGIYSNSHALDIGLGLHPDLTGKGLGSEFLGHALQFMNSRLSNTEYQLVVAAFNERAIKAYEKAGFQRGKVFHSAVNNERIPFVCMRCVYAPLG
jgi:[ribosomal protein S18]-alanine N-acetyltransferase